MGTMGWVMGGGIEVGLKRRMGGVRGTSTSDAGRKAEHRLYFHFVSPFGF